MSGLQAIMKSNQVVSQDDEILPDYHLGSPSLRKESDE
jgi:hypothetical protein